MPSFEVAKCWVTEMPSASKNDGADLIDSSEYFQKNVLSDVFNIFSISEKPACQPEYHRRKLIDDSLLSRWIA